jgi:hypothetical protein
MEQPVAVLLNVVVDRLREALKTNRRMAVLTRLADPRADMDNVLDLGGELTRRHDLLLQTWVATVLNVNSRSARQERLAPPDLPANPRRAAAYGRTASHKAFKQLRVRVWGAPRVVSPGGANEKAFYNNALVWVAPRAGLEPATQRLTAACSTN